MKPAIKPLLFKSLKPGFHSPPTKIKLVGIQKGLGNVSDSVVYHDVIYVSIATYEVLYQSNGYVYILTSDQFNQRGYMPADRWIDKEKT